MASAIAGFTPSTPTTSGAKSSLNTMSGSDFLHLMIQQLQQQDPLNPTDSNQLLTQISQISTLQSNTAMEQSLQGLTLQQSIGAGGNLIGKKVQGIDENGDGLDGTVTSVRVLDKKVFLELDSGKDLPMENVTMIAGATPADLASLASSLPQLQGLLQSAGSSNGSSNASNVTTLMNLLSSLGAK